MSSRRNIPVGVWKLALAACAAIWGGSFVVMKDTLDVIPPAWLMGIRFLVSALIVGALMHLVYFPPEEVSYLAGVAYVGVGQAIACYILGMPLFRVLERYEEKLFRLR